VSIASTFKNIRCCYFCIAFSFKAKYCTLKVKKSQNHFKVEMFVLKEKKTFSQNAREFCQNFWQREEHFCHIFWTTLKMQYLKIREDYTSAYKTKNFLKTSLLDPYKVPTYCKSNKNKTSNPVSYLVWNLFLGQNSHWQTYKNLNKITFNLVNNFVSLSPSLCRLFSKVYDNN